MSHLPLYKVTSTTLLSQGGELFNNSSTWLLMESGSGWRASAGGTGSSTGISPLSQIDKDPSGPR